MKRGHMPLPRPVSFSCDQLSIAYFDVDTADSQPENVDVEVAEYDSSTDEEKWKVEADTFRNLTDCQLSY